MSENLLSRLIASQIKLIIPKTMNAVKSKNFKDLTSKN